jgi:hypothetical protein
LGGGVDLLGEVFGTLEGLAHIEAFGLGEVGEAGYFVGRDAVHGEIVSGSLTSVKQYLGYI